MRMRSLDQAGFDHTYYRSLQGIYVNFLNLYLVSRYAQAVVVAAFLFVGCVRKRILFLVAFLVTLLIAGGWLMGYRYKIIYFHCG